MHPYIAVLLVAAFVSAMHAGAILARENQRGATHITALLILCGGLWALFQVAWNSASEPEIALHFMRLSGVAWVPIPVLALHLISKLASSPPRWVVQSLPFFYGLSAWVAAFIALTPWVHSGVVKTNWGWSYELGLGFIPVFTTMISISAVAILVGVRNVRNTLSPAEGTQIRWFITAFSVPITVGTVTDGLMPILGSHVPQLGSLSVALLGVVTAWSFKRFGYSVLVPTDFAREILGTLPDGIALLHLDGRIRSANHGLAALAGCSAQSLEQRTVSEMLTLPLEQMLPGIRDIESELLTAGGERVPVSLSTTLLRDRQDLPIGLVVTAHDLREVVGLRNRLVTSGRLAAVGELAAGVAHEINNPITYVRANLSQLQQHWKTLRDGFRRDEPSEAELVAALDEGDELIEESLEGVDRAAAIVRDIKGFSHAGAGIRETVDLNPLVESVLRVAAPQLSADICVERELGPIPPILGAPQELKQVFLNLLLNAAQSLQGRGCVRVSSQVLNDQIAVRIEDDGCGIQAETLERIFDPFFTTKGVGEGTGLGLAICHEIIRRHQGEIAVESTPGVGTRFEVRLPLADRPEPN